MDLRYPVGPFEFAGTLSNGQRQTLIDQIAATPEKMRAAVEGLSDEQLNMLIRTSRSMPGTVVIMWRTLLRCANAWDGEGVDRRQ
jgi:hypothetical protein